MNLRKTIFIASSAAVVFGCLAFIGSRTRNLTVNVDFQSVIQPVDPTQTPGQDWGVVLNQVFEKLFRITPAGSLQPELVEDWTVNNDFTEFDFKILDQVKFHNGKILRAKDAVYSVNHLLKTPPDSNSVFMLQSILSVTESGPLSFKIRLKEPVYDFLYFLAGPTIRIFPEGIFEKSKKPLDLWIGTGPFRVASFDANHIGLDRFDDYRTPVKIERLNFSKHRDPKVSFDKGDVDIFEISRQEVPKFQNDSRYIVNSYPELGDFFLGFNLRDRAFRNINVRKAILYAIDRSKLVEGVTIEPRFIPSGIIPFGLLGYEPQKEAYNLARAREYLNRVPLKDRPKASDMVVLVPQPFHPMGVFAINRIKEDLAKIGLPLTMRVLERDYGRGQLGNLYHHLRTTHDFKIYFRGLLSPLPSTMHVLREVFDPESPMNFGGYERPRYAEFLAKAPRVTKESELQKYYSDFSAAMMEEAPVIPLGVLYSNLVTRPEKPLKLNALSPYFISFKDAI